MSCRRRIVVCLRGRGVESRIQDSIDTRYLHFSFAFQSLGYPLWVTFYLIEVFVWGEGGSSIDVTYITLLDVVLAVLNPSKY